MGRAKGEAPLWGQWKLFESPRRPGQGFQSDPNSKLEADGADQRCPRGLGLRGQAEKRPVRPCAERKEPGGAARRHVAGPPQNGRSWCEAPLVAKSSPGNGADGCEPWHFAPQKPQAFYLPYSLPDLNPAPQDFKTFKALKMTVTLWGSAQAAAHPSLCNKATLPRLRASPFLTLRASKKS